MEERFRFYLGLHVGLWTTRYKLGKWELLSEAVRGRSVEDLQACPSRPEWLLAAVAWDGSYLTRDAGLHWEKVLNGDIRAITFDPSDDQVVYAGGGPVQLHRSTNRGINWEPLEALAQMPPEVRKKWGAPARYQGKLPGHVRHILVHPDDPKVLLVAIEHGGVVRSQDGGETWEDVSEGISYPDMHMVRSRPGSKDRFYVSSARGFFRSDDVAGGWTRVEDGMPWGYTEKQSYSHDWLFLPGNPRRMLVAGANGSPGFWDRPTRAEGVMLISDDDGEHWRQSNKGLPEPMRWMAATLVPHPENPSAVLAGMGDQSRGFGLEPGTRGSGAVYISRDQGNSWEPVIPDLPSIDSMSVALE